MGRLDDQNRTRDEASGSLPRRSASASSRNAHRPGLGIRARRGVRQAQAELHRAVAEDLAADAEAGRAHAPAPPAQPRALELPEPPAQQSDPPTSG
jgi:hypothetical protein